MSEDISKKEKTIEELKDEVLNNINLMRLGKIHSDLKKKTIEVEKENEELKTEMALKDIFNDGFKNTEQTKFTCKYCEHTFIDESNLENHFKLDQSIKVHI